MALDPNHQPENPNIASARLNIHAILDNKPDKKTLGQNVLASINNTNTLTPDPDSSGDLGDQKSTNNSKQNSLGANNPEFISNKVDDLGSIMKRVSEVVIGARNEEAGLLDLTDEQFTLAA